MKQSNRGTRRTHSCRLRDFLLGGSRFSASSRGGRRVVRGGLQVESLEARLLLAADALPDFYASSEEAGAPVRSSQELVLGSGAFMEAEGENTPAADLVAFAKALSAANVRLFGSAWCPTCTVQKELFEDGAQFLPFIESTDINRQPTAEAIANNITVYPTWIFPDGTRAVGFLPLQTIADRAEMTIPTSTAPFVAPLEDVVVLDGSPLHVALDGYDPNGGPLTFTVTSSNEAIVNATVLSGNRSAAIRFAGWGEIVVQLFEQRAGRATSQFIALAEAGFYDAANNDPDVTVHRVQDNFMMQFGDPTGTGAGGSTLGDFDDHFHPDLQHNTPGILSYAKSNDDTNDSQVFIIDVPTRYLDFNHSVFGLVTEGDSVRDAITAVKTNAGTMRPAYGVNMESVSIFQDTENGVVMLKAVEGASGTATITVTVTDEDGNSYVEQFDVTVQADTFNGGPYLADIGAVTTTMNQPAVFQLSAIDVEGDAVLYGGVKTGNVDYTFAVDDTTGEVTVTPPQDFVGELAILVYTRPVTTSNTQDVYDVQEVTVLVTPAAPQSVDLVTASDSGISDTDNVTNATTLEFLVSGVTAGALVQLHQGDTLLGQATAAGTSVTIAAAGLSAASDGTYHVYATQVINNEQSAASGSLAVTIDRTVPAQFTSTPPTAADLNIPLSYNVSHPEEAATGLLYSLLEHPAGAAIDPVTGVLSWTPTADDIGPQAFSIALTDLAGNQRLQEFSIDVLTAGLVAFRLEVTNGSGTPVSTVMVGETFNLRVYVADVAAQPYGVFSAFLDVLYDQQLVAVDGTVMFGSSYPNGRESDVATPGAIEETGGVAGLSDLGGGEFLLFTVPMRAVATGTAVFEGDPADELPLHEILRYGPVMDVGLEDVLYGATSLIVEPAFEAVDDAFSVNEDSGTTSLNVRANDQVFAGSPGNLTIVDVSSASQGGTVTVSSDALSVEYSPPANFFGVETFTYTVSDGTGTQMATVTVQVAPVNDLPTAVDDAVNVPEDSVSFEIDVLSNDLITPDAGETLTITGFSGLSAGGTLTIAAQGDRLLYTPAADFFGTETFSYTISDGKGGTASATVTVTITEQNDPPEATNDLFAVNEDSTGNVLDVLANDSTAGDDDETLTIVAVGVPEFGGTVTIAEDQLTLRYSPAANFFGNERFTYRITDGNGGFAEATVTVGVSGINDPPTAVADALTVVRNSQGNVLDVLANDSSSPDGTEVLTIVSIDSVSGNGTVTISNAAQVIYTPAADFSGTETFTYTIRDPGGATSQATATVTVTEYIPSSLSGYVYVDVDNDAVRDAGEVALGGVLITLQGTDQAGNAVSRTATTNALGYYQFTELAPGSYRVIQTQPEGMLDGQDRVGSVIYAAGTDTLQIELEQGTDLTNCNFGERGRASAGITLVDFFAKRPRESLLLAASSSGLQWYAVERGWSHAAALSLSVNASANSAQLAVVTSDAQQYSTTLNLNLRDHVQTLAVTPAGWLLRVVETPAVLFPSASCACGGEAEGESAPTVSGDAEGEAVVILTAPTLLTPAVAGVASAVHGDAYDALWSELADESEGEAQPLLPTPWDSHLAADVILGEAASWDLAPLDGELLQPAGADDRTYATIVDSLLDEPDPLLNAVRG